MQYGRPLCLGVALLGGLTQLHAQTSHADATMLLMKTADLSVSELARVQEAFESAVDGRTFRVAGLPGYGDPSLDVLMDKHGLKYVRSRYGPDIEAFDDYTGVQAVGCDGSSLDGELVIKYGRSSDHLQWMTLARTRTNREPLEDYSDVFNLGPRSGRLENMGGRQARAIVAHWTPTFETTAGATEMPAVDQVLWIDVDSLLPIRWELAHDGVAFNCGFLLIQDPSLVLHPPEGVPKPTCVRLGP